MGTIWTSPEIDHGIRRLMVLSMTIALNPSEEFRLHARAALEHGVAPDLIKETILQSAIYCGVPVANAVLHDFIAELGAQAATPNEN